MDLPEIKRKKTFTKSEVLLKLEQHENDVRKVAEEVVSELTPFDVTDDNVLILEDRLERVEKVTVAFMAKFYRLKSDIKARKFRKKPHLLEETVISSSQHSVLQSEQDSEDLSDSLSQSQPFLPDSDGREEMETDTEKKTERRITYKKKPLNHVMASFSRQRRVEEKMETLSVWAKEEGVTPTQLVGYLIHLENYHGGDRNLARLGWKIFTDDETPVKAEVSLEEATWIIEKSGMSQNVYQEIRLRLLGRIWLPPVMLVRAENQLHRPALSEYRHGEKASLSQCLSLSITERLQLLDLTKLDQGELFYQADHECVSVSERSESGGQSGSLCLLEHCSDRRGQQAPEHPASGTVPR